MIKINLSNRSLDNFEKASAFQIVDEFNLFSDRPQPLGETPEPRVPLLTPCHILIARPNGRLGNTLLLTPLVNELETLFPGAEIDIVSSCPAAPEIFREYSSVRTIHQLPQFGARHPAALVATFLTARRARYDLVIDPCPRSRSSRFWARFMLAEAKLGFRSARKKTGVNCSVPVEDAPHHMAHYPVDLIRRKTWPRLPDQERHWFPPLSIKLTASERELGAETLHNVLHGRECGRLVVGVFLHASGEKRLPVEFWRQLVRRLRFDLPTAQIVEMVAAHGQRLLPEAPGYFSTNIRRMARVIDAMDFFISADCGVMHLGAATSTATIGLFTVSDAAKYGPYGGNNAPVIVDCYSPQQSLETISRIIRAASQNNLNARVA